MRFSAVGPEKQIPERFSAKQGEPAPAAMLLPVVHEMAALAERHQVARVVVGGVVISVRCGQDNARGSNLHLEISSWSTGSDPPPLPVPPGLSPLIPPAAITKMADGPAVGAAAPLTLTFGPAEPDHSRELRPVDGVEPAVLRADRHPAPSHPSELAEA